MENVRLPPPQREISTKSPERLDSKGAFVDNSFAGWSSPVAREAHNLEVVSSNLAPATKALRSHVASDRGVFLCAGRDRGELIPLSANDLRLLNNLWASLFLPPAQQRFPHGLAFSSPAFADAVSDRGFVYVTPARLSLIMELLPLARDTSRSDSDAAARA